MFTRISAFLLSVLIVFSSCRHDHLISEKTYRRQVEKDFRERKKIADNRSEELFRIFKDKLDVKTAEALKYLYAYMPLSDLADYSGDFFLENVKISLRAREEFPWSNEIPEYLFLHYVLPVRVNNENLDSFRILYFNEIKSRVKGMSAESAALEINHWCHEKVTYQPSDSRTSGPLATILSARGRCGEESTFTVSALRAAGLPARQVYCPRWSHTDDNHAWVEVWLNGKWRYMGACEPEPVLDLGWFSGPATRAMLIHTKSFGAPSIQENAMCRTRNYSVINNLNNYAKTRKIIVRVENESGEPVKNARVEYKIYNYAEFFSLAILPVNENGVSEFETGYGDLLVWANDGNLFAFSHLKSSGPDTVKLILESNQPEPVYVEFDLDVPAENYTRPEIPVNMIIENHKRLAFEDSIREKYIASWITPEKFVKICIETGANTVELIEIIRKSMGNYTEIVSLIAEYREIPLTDKIRILKQVSEKDLRDTKAYVFADHLKNTPPYKPGKTSCPGIIYEKYVLNPRIEDEILKPWRGYFATRIPAATFNEAVKNPEILVTYVNMNITVNEEDNYYGTPLTPQGVHELKIADRKSRNIYFIALCRSAGIPARLENGTMRPQYFFENEWIDVYFNDENHPEQKGFLKMVNTGNRNIPHYYSDFTVARFENGTYTTLQFDYDMPLTKFGEKINLLPGNYMLVTGNRISDRKILASVRFFRINPGKITTIPVVIRK